MSAICGTCKKETDTYTQNTLTGQTWCYDCFPRSQTWKNIQNENKVTPVGMLIFTGALILLILAIIGVITLI